MPEPASVVWHYQVVHHGLWDRPAGGRRYLADITVNGRRNQALAQNHQASICLRAWKSQTNGQPVSRSDERPVPAGNVPGEGIRLTTAESVEAVTLRSAGRTRTRTLIDFTNRTQGRKR
jgi:glucose dehydrogenase